MAHPSMRHGDVERARMFSLLADARRLTVFEFFLKVREPLTVSEIAEHIEMSHSATSHLLGVLFRAGVVENVREGREKRYRLRKSPFVRALGRIVKTI